MARYAPGSNKRKRHDEKRRKDRQRYLNRQEGDEGECTVFHPVLSGCVEVGRVFSVVGAISPRCEVSVTDVGGVRY